MSYRRHETSAITLPNFPSLFNGDLYLELADSEFSTLRSALATYANSVVQQIEENPREVSLDRISLISLLNLDSNAHRLDVAVAQTISAVVNPSCADFIDHLLSILKWCRIETVAELERVIKKNFVRVERFAKLWLEKASYESFASGIGISYLAYLLVGETGDETRVLEYLNDRNIGSVSNRPMLAQRVLQTARAVKDEDNA